MMNETDAVSEALESELNNIWNNRKSENSRKGDMGEVFVKNAIRQSFFDKGYKIAKKGKGTFRVHKQVKSGNKGRGEIDFNVTFTDENGNSGEWFVESKNWGDYPISKDTYKTEIKDRFNKVDSSNNKKRALAIPKSHTNSTNIKNNCPKDKITVIPIEQQITDHTINNKQVKSTFKNFKDEMDKYIEDFVPDITNRQEDSIERDLTQGKDYTVVAKKWDKSEGHIRNIASKLVSYHKVYK